LFRLEEPAGRTRRQRRAGPACAAVRLRVPGRSAYRQAGCGATLCPVSNEKGRAMERSVLDDIQDRLRATRRELEQELDRQLESRREQFRYRLHRGKVLFDHEMRALQKTYRTGLWSYVSGARIAIVLTAPLIYSLVIPLALLDLSVTLYQQVCFRVYGIGLVRRADYVVIDRHRLAYLNLIEKINCAYCGYGNGVIAYAREIAGRTEAYWCPIKHARKTLEPHESFASFMEFGDAEAYRDWLASGRKAKPAKPSDTASGL
jgi:hypothetical protein